VIWNQDALAQTDIYFKEFKRIISWNLFDFWEICLFFEKFVYFLKKFEFSLFFWEIWINFALLFFFYRFSESTKQKIAFPLIWLMDFNTIFPSSIYLFEIYLQFQFGRKNLCQKQTKTCQKYTKKQNYSNIGSLVSNFMFQLLIVIRNKLLDKNKYSSQNSGSPSAALKTEFVS
jgi:hypothetical protein